MATSRFSARPSVGPDAIAIRALFQRAFGHPMDSAWQAWKYNTMGGIAEVLTDSMNACAVVAHYGGFPRLMVNPDGRQFHSLQIGDVMVDPSVRGVLGKKVPFVQVAESFLNRHVGIQARNPDSSYHWIYGFPNMRHMQIGERHGLYRDAGPLWECQWDLNHRSDESARPRRRIHPPYERVACKSDLEPLNDQMISWSKAIARLWACMVVQRDSAWWHMRYLEWPDYMLWTDKVTGCVALRWLDIENRTADRTTLEWLDGIAAPEKWPSLLRDVLEIASGLGAKRLVCWASDIAFQTLQSCAHPAFSANPLLARVGTSHWVSAPHDNRLWLMGGDSDFR